MMEASQTTRAHRLTHFENGVIRTLLYFDVFKYPLTFEEIVSFHPRAHSVNDIAEAVSTLKNQGVLFKLENFYSLHPDPDLAERRLTGNELAQRRLKTAKLFSNIISKFPFVRGVMLSGSLSKNYMDEHSDIDYFIVTAPGRLWLTRGMLALFKRIFLLNSHKFFCTNYLIDTESLEIEEKNIYTAIEIATLIPVYGKDVYNDFITKNTWTKTHLPNNSITREAFINETGSLVRNILENFFSGKLGERLDRLFFRLATKRWQKKFSANFSTEEFNLAFKSKPNIYKNHPQFYQKKTLENYRKRLEDFELINNMKLTP